MEDIWTKVANFLRILNGENVKRKDYVTTPEYQAALQRLQDAETSWEEYLENLSEADREKIEGYLDCMEEMASSSEQRAYVQGYVDCVQVLNRIGLLKGNPDVVVPGIETEEFGVVERENN